LPWSAEDAAVAMLYVGLAVLVTAGLWGSAATADNPRDHAWFLFLFQNAAHALTHGDNPLFTPLMGAPDGVNLMANTGLLGLTVPLIPVTLTAGPTVSYGLSITVGLSATATAWYVVLRRHVTANQGVAAAAGALGGFSPGIVGHAVGHPNFTAQFVLPFIVSAVIRLRSATKPVRSGIALGLMIAYQILLNEELLFFTALACLVMVVVFVASRPRQALAEAKRFLIGLGVAVGVAVVVDAYPLWFQFFGPQHYRGPFYWAPVWHLDLVSYPSYGFNAIAGWLGAASRFNNDPDETNAFLGAPLCILALVAAVTLWRVLAVRIAAVLAAVFMVLSLGDKIQLRGVDTGVPGPWRQLRRLPFFDTVITSRLGLVVAPAVAVLLACACDRLLAATPGAPGAAPEPGETPADLAWRRPIVWGVLAALLLPLFPTTVKITAAQNVPPFYTTGTWRDYVGSGTIVPIPPDPFSEPTLRALLATDLEPRFVDGYFIGPSAPDRPQARYGPPDRPTTSLLRGVATSGQVPAITDTLRANLMADLRYWGADCLVLAPTNHDDALRRTVADLLGQPGRPVAGVWVWDVRALVVDQARLP
jgi:hypothetical protein